MVVLVCSTVCITPPAKFPSLPVISVSVEEASPVETEVPLVADVVVPAAVAVTLVAVSVVEEVACSKCCPTLSDGVGLDEVWLD